jgi:hypothetical protein
MVCTRARVRSSHSQTRASSEFAAERNASSQAMKARLIMERFVSEDAISPVDIPTRIVERIRAAFDAGGKVQPSLFEQAQAAVFAMMVGEYYPGFAESSEFEQMRRVAGTAVASTTASPVATGRDGGGGGGGGGGGKKRGGGGGGGNFDMGSDLNAALQALEEFG